MIISVPNEGQVILRGFALIMSNFTTLSSEYQQRAVLQKSAGQKLFDLLNIQRTEAVIDLGCGPGHLTRKIRDLTDGAILGIDPSEGMIAEAQRNCEGLNITFQVCAAESLDEAEAFDVIFCNSAFQWFRDPQRVLNNCHHALRSGGRLGIQAPARASYCPNFIQAADTLLADPRTRTAFLQFRSPWFFLETSDDYAQLCKVSGFLVNSCWIEEVAESCSPDKAFEMFESGAAAGYLNPDCYDTTLPLGFTETARKLIALAFRSQTNPEGTVSLTFSRFYLLAHKP